MKPTQTFLPFKLTVANEERATVTAHAGVPLVVETMRALVSKRAYKNLSTSLGYARWKTARRHIESLVALIAAGGDCIDDLRVLRGDGGLVEMLGGNPSSPSQAKDFLYRFHTDEQGEELTAEDDAALSRRGEARIRAEGPGLRVLEGMVASVVRGLQSSVQQRRATLDVDATIIEAHKKTALKAYEGTVGYQPQMAWWAEHSGWVCDEFRDGNVPAAFDAQRFLQRSFAALPGSVTERRLRADSALYDEKALTWADAEGIQFAVSADMSPALTQAIKALPDSAWKPYTNPSHPDAAEERQCAEVVFVPGWARNRKKRGEPFRYIAIRVRGLQQDLLRDGEEQWRHFAIVTNMTWKPARLLRWQREKQGTVEHAHGELKNELAGGTLPTGKFGANAAWWRINVLVMNLLRFLKTKLLPAGMRSMRPKALRFHLFNLAARLAHHARQLVVTLGGTLPSANILLDARERLLAYVTRSQEVPP